MRKGILRGPQEDEDEEEKEEEAHSEGSGAAHDGTGRTSQSTAATTNNNKQKRKGKKGVQLGGSSSYTTASCSSSASSSSSMPSRGGAVHWKRLVGGTGSGSGGLPSASPARVLSQDAPSPAAGGVRLREFHLKVVVLGESGVGKTCLIRRFVHDAFSSGYKATIGVDFATKNIIWNDRYLVKLALWDVGGQNARNITSVFYRGASGALLVCDVKNANSQNKTAEWKDDLDEKLYSGRSDKPPFPCVLVGNKVDILKDPEDQHAVARSLKQRAQELHCHSSHLTSAKNDVGIDRSVCELLDAIFVHMKPWEEMERDTKSGLMYEEQDPPVDVRPQRRRSGACGCSST